MRHAIEKATLASLKNAFAVTGLCHTDRYAIERLQLVDPTFPSKIQVSACLNMFNYSNELKHTCTVLKIYEM